MNQPLDLCITLTPPPAGSLSNVIASIALRCDPQGLSHTGDVLTDPLTQQEREELRWYLEEYSDWPYEQFLERAKKIEALLPELGKRLYKTVFGSFGAMAILQAWRLQPGEQRQISIVSDMPVALSLPWELLHDQQGFLVLRTRHPVSIVRRLSQSEQAALPTPFEPPLRVLLVTARPEGAGFVDPRGVARELVDEVQAQVEAGAIELEFLRPPTRHALRNRLGDPKRPPIHVLHFDGHGTFDEEVDEQDGLHLGGGKQGMLAFENDEGKLDLVKAEDVAQILQDSGVRLAMLTACQSAMSTADDAFSSVAARLIKSGVDAVAAMSASVLVVSAARYVEAFYHALTEGASAPVAQERARQALYDDPRRHVLRRRRDEEGKPVELRDWWLPHFYQQRPLELRPTRPSGQLKQESIPSSVRLSDTMPAEPRYGFSGRAYELLQLERWLMRGKLVVIHGFGGVGKTALVRETADWLTRTKMYNGACFVSFEHGGDSATLLSTLGNFMGVYDGHYNPNDPKAALAKLGPALKEKHTLVIADNMESILPNGEAPLEASVRTQLWNVLLELSKMGAGVLLTSRDTNFGDGRLAPGKHVAHLPLGGLHPEDAYVLASRLLDDLQIDRARAPYAELRDLLVQLDHHPLAIQLVLPALKELPLANIRTDFGALLPKFVDDTVMGRNQSLLASLEYSLRRLSKEQRALLPRLAVFEGGASEARLLAITEIPESEWAKLRQALEQAALLTAEHIHEGVSVPFLRFHPVLTPYLRNQPGADDPALRERYAKRYYGLARYLYHEDDRNPQPVRALVQKELPNLRRALDLLLEDGELDAASDMAARIAMFLNNFGLWRELDELRRRVAETITAKGTSVGSTLMRAEYLRESGLGDDEYRKGDLQAAYTRFLSLLARIEELAEGTPLGRGSYEHCSTLHWLARCLNNGGQPAAAEGRLANESNSAIRKPGHPQGDAPTIDECACQATGYGRGDRKGGPGIGRCHARFNHLRHSPTESAEGRLREAMTIIDRLIKQQPEDQILIRNRGVLLADLGDVLCEQGAYLRAREAYEEGLKIARQQDGLRQQDVVLTQLGTLAQKQKDYADARSHYIKALEIDRVLGEPAMEAVILHLLGSPAIEQKEWAEAEDYYRESLAINEQIGNIVNAAMVCNQLAIVAEDAGRPAEAEGWYKRALELDERVDPGSKLQVAVLNNLANLLVNEMRAGRSSKMRLTEARSYAERALAIRETLDASSEIWNTFNILAAIANLEGQTEEARAYRRRERETFAAFAGNRYHIDRQHGQLIAAIAAAAKGNLQAKQAVEEVLPEREAKGWQIAAATHRIWAGERDWHSLVEGIDRNSALLVLRVLETIAQPTEAEIIVSLPPAIREALKQGDEAAFEQALEALPPEEQQKVVDAIQYLQVRRFGAGQIAPEEQEVESYYLLGHPPHLAGKPKGESSMVWKAAKREGMYCEVPQVLCA